MSSRNAKNLLKSKTFWTNMVIGILGLLSGQGVDFGPVAPVIEALTDPMTLGALNVGLRAVTSEPVKLSGGK